jgi:hypothetical protein
MIEMQSSEFDIEKLVTSNKQVSAVISFSGFRCLILNIYLQISIYINTYHN